MATDTNKPRAFRLDDPNVVMSDGETAPPRTRGAVLVTPEPDDAVDAVDSADVAYLPGPRGSRWGAILWSALGGLVSLAIGLWVTRLIDELFSYSDWFGWLGACLAALAALSFLAILIREVSSLMRLARIEGLHERAAAAILADDRDMARDLVRDLLALYRSEARTARARSVVDAAAQDIVDGADLVRVAERELMTSLDADARRIVADAAKRVSVVTAVSPRALVDLLFVMAETFRMLRRLAALYGGRPGGLALVTLLRHALGNLAITGGMAAGDSILSQALGHGLASRISAKLGEGVLNGLLIARLGVAAISVIRPLPFNALPRPGVTDVAGGLFARDDKDVAAPK